MSGDMILMRDDLCEGPIVVDETSMPREKQSSAQAMGTNYSRGCFTDSAYCYGEPNDSLARQTEVTQMDTTHPGGPR